MKITTFITSLVFLCAGMCCPPEDDHDYENFEFDAPGLIEIQNDGNVFNQNDTLWVKTIIPNTLFDEDGEEIDLLELRGINQNAYLGLNLYLENGFDQPIPIILSEDEIFPITGTVTYQYSIDVNTTEVNGQIQSDFGIVLKEKGDYFLGSSYLPNPLSVYLEGENYNQILINTNFANQDSDRFQFSVE
ncbi:hypothetical protein RM545_10195 [Zunongwangia sp. F260]|uniref:Uncharacterized protein n=1 Tax=Autumnicola lenta TaxID=3075593 RepID=A0ABU3CL36_9FLAO|nr:hypothetical protein [Zunongwangia sp. F260]MDT0647062.1 hypothetical protein [Zunongwangia sp. F260]